MWLTLLRWQFQPHSARGNETVSITLLNFGSGFSILLSGSEITNIVSSFIWFLSCLQWALLGHCHLGDRWTYCCPVAEEATTTPHPSDLWSDWIYMESCWGKAWRYEQVLLFYLHQTRNDTEFTIFKATEPTCNNTFVGREDNYALVRFRKRSCSQSK